MEIPRKARSKEEVLQTLQSYKANDMPWRDGRTWAYVYDPGAAAEEVIKQAYSLYLSENGLDPTVFPSILRLENELVAMAAAHLKGDHDVVGNFTSGGTESLILAVKTARDFARAKRPQIKEPEIILPTTAHAAFHKACHYLCVKPVLVPVDTTTFKADPEAIRRAITPNTILLVGSAVSYAHGVVDPIRDIGQIALEHDLLLHVDGCMGGFLLPYFRRLGAPVPDFEFNVPGVTSISMDFHKYAFAAKGASVILHRNKDLRRHQIYACANWTGYTIINPTVQSTKSAGPLAAAWAVLNFIGDDGYLEMIERGEISAVDGLRLLGKPEMNLVAFTSDVVSVFHVIDEMKDLGWYIQPQLGLHGSKENIHLSVNPASVKWVDALLADLKTCVDKARSMPSGELAEMVRGALGSMDLTTLSDEQFSQLLGMAGVEGSEVPKRMAGVNEMMNTLPAAVRERLLTEYLNQLFHQP